MIIEPEKVKFSESEQALSIKFAWAIEEGNKYKLQHWWVLCRDFLVDAVYWTKYPDYNEKKYGFKINPEEFIIKPLLAIEFSGHHRKLAQKFLDNIKCLHKIENKWKKTKVMAQYEDDKRVVLVLSFSHNWIKSAFGISLYTFLIKVLAVNAEKFMEMDEEAFSYPENSYILSTKNLLSKALEKLNELKHPSFLFDDSNDYHDNNGFVSQLKRNGALLAQLA